MFRDRRRIQTGLRPWRVDPHPCPAVTLNARARALFRYALQSCALGLMCVGLPGCGNREAPPTHDGQPPLIQQPLPAAPQRTETVSGELTAGGIPASYRALFAEDQLTRISETRNTNRPRDGAAYDAQYEFKGARLLQYTGASLSGADRIDLEFDVQGALVAARGNSENVSQEQISAIRTRAQTLRSHALARRAVQAHAGH